MHPLHLVALAAALGLGLVVETGSDDARRHPSDTPHAGLPLPGHAWAPYAEDPAHPANRVFRALFVAEVDPVFVGAVLAPVWEAGALPEDWMLQWRAGTDADRRTFGGDGRQLPRDGFTAAEAEGLVAALENLGEDEIQALRARPALAVLFQHDLLRMVQRLGDSGRNPELVPRLLAAARAVALPRTALDGLSDPLEREGAAPADERATQWYRGRAEGWVELERRSTRLFDPARTLLWTRVWIAHPGGREATLALLDDLVGVEVPIGMRGLLAQGIVALDDEGRAVATPIVIDVRAQVLAHRDGLAAKDATTSRDGVDFSLLQLEREGLRRASERPVYRVVEDDDQDLFRDYGTLKHTTYRAQCTLCHRTTRTPEPELGGFPVLRAHAKPRPAAGDERLRAAEAAVEGVIEAWVESAGGF